MAMRNVYEPAGPKQLTPLGELVVGLIGAVALSVVVFWVCRWL
jgi:hypothetical protein